MQNPFRSYVQLIKIKKKIRSRLAVYARCWPEHCQAAARKFAREHNTAKRFFVITKAKIREEDIYEQC